MSWIDFHIHKDSGDFLGNRRIYKGVSLVIDSLSLVIFKICVYLLFVFCYPARNPLWLQTHHQGELKASVFTSVQKESNLKIFRNVNPRGMVFFRIP